MEVYPKFKNYRSWLKIDRRIQKKWQKKYLTTNSLSKLTISAKKTKKDAKKDVFRQKLVILMGKE